MIRVDPEDGSQILTYEDWTPLMIALSHRLGDLPRRPGSTGRSTHPLGIDRLKSGGERTTDPLALLCLARAIDEVEFCPDADEVIRIGRGLLDLDVQLSQLCQERDRNEQWVRDRRAAKRRARDAVEGDRRHNGPTPVHGFRRGPRAIR